MIKRNDLPRATKNGGGLNILFLKRIEDINDNTRHFFGGRFGYKQRLNDFLNAIVERGGEAGAIKGLGYNWWLYKDIKANDKVFSLLVDDQRNLITTMAEEMLYQRAMHGYEETVEENGVIVRRVRKVSERGLLEFLKTNSSQYSKAIESEDKTPPVKILNFDEE